MLDGGALPAWFSRSCAELRQAGWLAAVVTAGQAFGGDLEAVTVHTGLLAARHVLHADLAVVSQGPGNLGTGTRWGFSGVASGEAVNAAAVLGGRPVAALRVSEADPRERHRGVSHHSLTAYGRVALARADVVVPELPGPFGARSSRKPRPLGARHTLVRVPVDGLYEALRACPVRLSTMGRGWTRIWRISSRRRPRPACHDHARPAGLCVRPATRWLGRTRRECPRRTRACRCP